jgi:formylglycine-generating enzyme required for sulfatase activity
VGQRDSTTSSKTTLPPSATLPTASDVFLSHNSHDKPAVEELARRLLNSGITPWLDMWNLIPGEPWQEAIEAALTQCTSCAVFVGPSGAGPWQNEEMRAAIDQRVRDSSGKFRVIPVFLPGAVRDQERSLPTFLRRQTWVEFKDTLDEEDAFRRLVCGIQGKAPGPASSIAYQGECPYRGLQSFDVPDSRLFFGREALKSRLVARLCPTEGPRQRLRFLGILGPSGSGKSSLARAGLVAAIQNGAIEGSGEWPTLIFRPGCDPIESLAVGLSGIYEPLSDPSRLQEFIRNVRSDERTLHVTVRLVLRNKAPDCRVLVLVDQFEEVFTLCHDEASRKVLVDNLVFACGVVGGQSVVCVVMRTDFYGKCAVHSSLANALSSNQILVDAMSAVEMRSAIEEPAQLTGYRFEPGLVDVLLEDALREPSALPLLQHALLELWEHRRGNLLTHASYKEIGGLEGALERRAEKIFTALDKSEQAYAKRILLRLIQPGQGTEATKRRAPLTELASTLSGSSMLDSVISRLTAPDARLLTTQASDVLESEPTVELSHEALIKGWKRLREWIEEDRQNLITQRRLTEATNEWLAAEKNDAYLYRGPLLSTAAQWAELHAEELSPQERGFLEESRDESAEQSRISDAASLDQLEAAARDIWLNVSEMERWVVRARSLTVAIEGHRRQVDRYRREGKIDSNEVWRFTNDERQFQHDRLSLLITRLERFRAGLMSAAEHVFTSLPRLGELNETVFKGNWARAIAEIHDLPQYGGFTLKPQLGLVPIGCDPLSGLWEFAHLVTGSVPDRDEEGHLVLEELTGIILVLIPSGKFSMGAIRPTPQQPLGSPNTDPYAMDYEGPIHTVSLRPFFISKYEMTQGQWLRAAGANPSMFRPDNAPHVTLLHPVECVSWTECIKTLAQVGLTLPTEAQWEYAARAGTTSVWFVGNDPELLFGKANLNQAGHTPVGAFNLANAFGLYDVIGNVWEWCRDQFSSFTSADRDGDSGLQTEDHFMPGSRGGSFFNDASFARSAIRYFRTVPEARFNNRGLRPAKPIE